MAEAGAAKAGTVSDAAEGSGRHAAHETPTDLPSWRAAAQRRSRGAGRRPEHVDGVGGVDRTGAVGEVGPVDLARAEQAVADLLDALGINRSTESLIGTPGRVARAYAELLTPEPFTATTFPNDESYDELVVARDIPFSSLCEHHLLPFTGVAHVAYLPGQRLLGLSKLARVVSHYARRLQVQERLTTQVAGWLVEELHPKGVGVVIEAEHACMAIRGVQVEGTRTVTSALAGLVRDDPRTRAEFLALVNQG